MLFLFNDPWYIVHILSPTIFTSILNELQMCIFMAGLLVFWLREIARFSPVDAQYTSKLAKFIQNNIFVHSRLLSVLIVLYFLLLADFMFMYVVYYARVQEVPGFSFTHINDIHGADVIFVLVVTISLLLTYYTLYISVFVLNFKHIMKSDTTTKVVFLISQIVHVLFVVGICFGIYSEKFLNGGAQIFFIGIVNTYVYFLVFLFWPVKKMF
jgi:Wnt-binding factor required for Wnt secretion